MGFFDFVKSKNSNSMSLEDKLSMNLLNNEMQAKVYIQVQNAKHYVDQLMISPSEDDINSYREVVLEAFESAVEIYEWLKEKEIHELNAIVLLSSFYLVNLSDVTLKDPTQFSEMEISNTIDTFLAGIGVQKGEVDTSSYIDLVRIGIDWLLKHPTNK